MLETIVAAGGRSKRVMFLNKDAQQPGIAAEGCDVWAAVLPQDGSEVQWAHIIACSNGDWLKKDIAMPPKKLPPGQLFATRSLFDRELVWY